LILEAPAEERSAGGIIIPDSAKEKPSRGLVIAVGKGRLGEPTETKPGDIVLYGKYAGVEIQIKGIDYLIMRESDLLMILPKD
jgi:chaperonin GroES